MNLFVSFLMKMQTAICKYLPPLLFSIYLQSQREPIIQVADLFEDIKCGVVLLTLLEVLSGEKLVREYIIYFIFAQLENIIV